MATPVPRGLAATGMHAIDLRLWVTPTPFAVFAFDKDEHRRQANKARKLRFLIRG